MVSGALHGIRTAWYGTSSKNIPQRTHTMPVTLRRTAALLTLMFLLLLPFAARTSQPAA